MSDQLLYNTQRIRGFQHERHEFSAGKLIWHIRRRKIQCRHCGNESVQKEVMKRRRIRGLPCGTSEVFFEFDVHRLYCPRCRSQKMEELHFLSHAKSRMTRSLERTVLELRKHMSIRAVCGYFHLRWHTVKELEKEALARKFRRIQTAHIKAVGIDEIHVGKRRENSGFLTVVRDLESGAVIHVGDGKGIDALSGALKKLKKSRLRVVTMDMANAYSSWIAKNFPKVHIVFDHFHVVKLMNEKLDKIRRRVVGQLDETQRKQFKGLRFIFLQNQEELCEDARDILRNIREQFKPLGDAWLFKESLRSIYANSNSSYHARIAFHRWCAMAERCGVPELKQMASTIRDKLDGIVTFWTFHHLTNASMEGFNNKIRWLIRQAYGFRDMEYFKLKIFQLPEISCVKEL